MNLGDLMKKETIRIDQDSLTVPIPVHNTNNIAKGSLFNFKENIPDGALNIALRESIGISNNRAILFVTPRKRMTPQIIRPMLYNFDNAFLNNLSKKIDMGHGVKNISNVDINSMRSIHPSSSGGIQLNMNIFQECFSFVLHITERIPGNNDAVSVTIYSGYFVDEPVSLNGQTNPYAKFFITNTSNLTHNKNNIFGGNNSLNISPSTCVISGDLERNLKQDTPLFWNTLGDLSMLPDSNVLTNNTGHLSRLKVNNLDAGANGSKNILKLSNVPGVLLNNVVTAAEQWAFNRTIDQDINDTGIGNDSISLDTFSFNHEIQRRIPAISIDSGNINFASGLDETIIHTLGELMSQFGNDLRIMNVSLRDPNMVANGHEIDQLVNTKQTQFSYMLSYCIEPIASRCCIDTISFEYHSHIPTETISLTKEGVWRIQEVTPSTITIDKNTLQNYVYKFQREMEDYVLPTIKSFIGDGDYSLWVIYKRGSVVDINLKLHDYISHHQNGFYESYGHLDPMISPTVGNVNTILSNKSSIDSLKNALLTM